MRIASRCRAVLVPLLLAALWLCPAFRTYPVSSPVSSVVGFGTDVPLIVGFGYHFPAGCTRDARSPSSPVGPVAAELCYWYVIKVHRRCQVCVSLRACFFTVCVIARHSRVGGASQPAGSSRDPLLSHHPQWPSENCHHSVSLCSRASCRVPCPPPDMMSLVLLACFLASSS